MFSLEIIIPIIVVAAVCAVYIILRGRRDQRRAPVQSPWTIR